MEWIKIKKEPEKWEHDAIYMWKFPDGRVLAGSLPDYQAKNIWLLLAKEMWILDNSPETNIWTDYDMKEISKDSYLAGRLGGEIDADDWLKRHREI